MNSEFKIAYLFNNRLNRVNFLIANLTLFLVSSFIIVFHDEFNIINNPYIKLAIFAVLNLSLLIRRLHDIGLTGWLSPIGAIPIIGIIFHIALYLIKGNKKNNIFGAPQERVDIKSIFGIYKKQASNPPAISP